MKIKAYRIPGHVERELARLGMTPDEIAKAVAEAEFDPYYMSLSIVLPNGVIVNSSLDEGWKYDYSDGRDKRRFRLKPAAIKRFVAQGITLQALWWAQDDREVAIQSDRHWCYIIKPQGSKFPLVTHPSEWEFSDPFSPTTKKEK